MPVILCSTPADHSRYGTEWPWVPYTNYPLPDETFSPEAQKEKMPLVKKIATTYETPLSGDNDDDNDGLHFTGYQNAAFYSLTPAALRAIAPFPELVKDIGYAAEQFGIHFFPQNNAKALKYQCRYEWKYPMPRSIRRSANQRDVKTCLVMGTKGIDHARIVPLLISVLSEKKFEVLFEFAKRFFAQNFRPFLRGRIKSLRENGDRIYNILSLSPDIRELFEKALVGFKPLYVGATRSERSVTYHATFSFHVIGRNQIKGYERVVPSDGTLYQMQSPCDLQKLTETEICALDTCIMHDGKVIQVPCGTRHEAESMLSLLAFRWTASSYWFLAGSPGSQRHEESSSDEELSSDGKTEQDDSLGQGNSLGQDDTLHQDNNLGQDNTVCQENSTWAMASVKDAIKELEEKT